MNTNKTLLLFIHGLGGNSKKTWGKFPQLIKQDPQLGSMVDVGFYSYPTTLVRIPFISSAPKIQTLADGLASQLKHTYKDYQRIIIVAHSLGGLVARKYLVNLALQQQSHRVVGLMLYLYPMMVPDRHQSPNMCTGGIHNSGSCVAILI